MVSSAWQAPAAALAILGGLLVHSVESVAGPDASGKARADILLNMFPEAGEALDLCPADAYAPRLDATFPDCIGFEACVASCLGERNGIACFDAARILEPSADPADIRSTQTLFSLGCARGDAGSCTNRAAAMLTGKPADVSGAGDVAPCALRTFELTCDLSHSWGCTMLGLAHHFGHGVEADETLARRFYVRSCEIDPEGESCGFARGGMAKLDAH